MKIIEKQLIDLRLHALTDGIPVAEMLYFDIETTGLSAGTSYLYMIGILLWKAGRTCRIQLLAEDISEEKELLMRFFQIAAGYQQLVHYNGRTFDIPYLLKKAKHYQMQCSLQNMQSLDIYHEMRKIKHALGLPDLKLKTLESFLGLQRRDVFSAEELIQLYAEYTGFQKLAALRPEQYGAKTEALRQSLLLHNAEDLSGLAEAVKLLHLLRRLQNPASFAVKIIRESEALRLVLHMQDAAHGTFSHPLALHLNIAGSAVGKLHIKNTAVEFYIPFYEGELKYFFDPHTEYYYLPEEDMAVHKSVGEFVDKAYRQKAKKSTCYQKKQGVFLPQTQAEDLEGLPAFRKDYRDKACYFEWTDAFDETAAKKYAAELAGTALS